MTGHDEVFSVDVEEEDEHTFDDINDLAVRTDGILYITLPTFDKGNDVTSDTEKAGEEQ